MKEVNPDKRQCMTLGDLRELLDRLPNTPAMNDLQVCCTYDNDLGRVTLSQEDYLIKEYSIIFFGGEQ